MRYFYERSLIFIINGLFFDEEARTDLRGYDFKDVWMFLAPDYLQSIHKVAVVGAGCAGLSAAWHLNRSGIDVSLIEIDSRIGGHANTINADGVDVDTGFMVYNSKNYPYMMALFEELKVEGEETNMGFSVSMDNGSFEWCGDSISGLFASFKNIFNPEFYKMFYDILRFNSEAVSFLKLSESDPERNLTVGEFLSKRKYSDAFAKYYLVPMTAAIWSASTDGIMSFPALTLMTFLNNHLLLQVSGHMVWRTPKNRSQTYVKAIEKELQSKIFINTKITSITRDEKGHHITDHTGKTSSYDAILFACHPDQILELLGPSATLEEIHNLSKFNYSSNDTYVHTDETLMPKNKAAWASWNYLGESSNFKSAVSKPVFVTYWLNRLQNLNHTKNLFVSLNPSPIPQIHTILSKISYSHPQYTKESIAGQRLVSGMQGKHRTWYSGAWMGYGFHEDGVRSGLDAAVHITGKSLPWCNPIHNRMNATSNGVLAPIKAVKVSWMNGIFSFILKPVTNVFIALCRQQIQAFLRTGFKKGKITIISPTGQSASYGSCASDNSNSNGEVNDDNDHVIVRVKNPWFWVRVALEYDLGLGKSYMADEWEVVKGGNNYEGMTRMLTLFISNMSSASSSSSTSSSKKGRMGGGLNVSNLATAWIGGLVNMFWYRLTMDNSIANSRSNIHAHYDLSNGLFETFLDKEHMMYSCGLFECNGTVTHPDPNPSSSSSMLSKVVFTDSLESAQRRKIDALLHRLGPISSDNTLLDIGFGWGGISIRAAELYGCKVTGITLSTEQKAMAEQRVRMKGLQHLITFELVDYRIFAARGLKFDRIVSCEMIEAVGHNHLGEFFACIERMLADNGVFVMQAITTPEPRYTVNVKSADFCNTIIFPGGCCPSLTALLDAMTKNSTLYLDNMCNINIHYAQTLREWRRRFNESLPRIYSLGFDDTFIRCWNLYLSYCEAGFEAQIMNLLLLTFSRPEIGKVVVAAAVAVIVIVAVAASTFQSS
eukprot:gene3419-6783_t